MFNKVVLAEMKKTRQLCAIKVVKKKDILKDDTADSSMLERNILALGRKCRFLTALLAAFQSTERLFFVMEFVGGGDLYHLIHKVPPSMKILDFLNVKVYSYESGGPFSRG